MIEINLIAARPQRKGSPPRALVQDGVTTQQSGGAFPAQQGHCENSAQQFAKPETDVQGLLGNKKI